MGMFTEVVNTATNRVIQFKCGHDECERFNVGDAVPTWISKYEAGAGYLLDGVYLGTESPNWEERIPDSWKHAVDRFVIVKDRRIHAIVDPVRDEDGSMVAGQEAHLLRLYQIKPPDLSLWSDELWAKKAKREAEWARERAMEEAEDFGLPPEERGMAALQRFTRKKMSQEGFFHRIMPPIPVTESEESR